MENLKITHLQGIGFDSNPIPIVPGKINLSDFEISHIHNLFGVKNLVNQINFPKLPIEYIQATLSDGSGESGYIEGIVKEEGIPVSRNVMCYHRKSKRLVSMTTSSKTGYYRLDGLVANVKYFVLSLDEFSDGKQFPAVIQDLIPAKVKV